MKKIIPLLLVLLLLLSACGGEKNEETNGSAPSESRSEEGPEGILEEKDTVTIYQVVRQTVTDENGAEVWRREYDYDESGFCTEEREYSNVGGTAYVRVNTPDSQGRIASSEYTEVDGTQYTVRYTYDDNGWVTREETVRDGQVEEYTEYTYNAQGDQLTMKTYYGGDLTVDIAHSYTYNEAGLCTGMEEFYFGELFGSVEITFDESGHELSSIYRDPDGSQQSRTESTWEGLTETRQFFDADSGTPYMTYVITYDENGNILLQENQGDGWRNMTEFVYEPFEVKK